MDCILINWVLIKIYDFGHSVHFQGGLQSSRPVPTFEPPTFRIILPLFPPGWAWIRRERWLLCQLCHFFLVIPRDPHFWLLCRFVEWFLVFRWFLPFFFYFLIIKIRKTQYLNIFGDKKEDMRSLVTVSAVIHDRQTLLQNRLISYLLAVSQLGR